MGELPAGAQTFAQVGKADEVSAGDRQRGRPRGEKDEACLGQRRAEGQRTRRRHDERRDAAAHARGVALLEALRALEQGVARGRGLRQRAQEGREAPALLARALGDEQVRPRELAVEEGVEVEQAGPAHGGEQERRQGKGKKNEQFADVVSVIEAGDGLAHGADAVGEREPGAQGLEEGRLHLDGVEARGAGDLQDHEQHRERLAHVLERGGEGVDHEDVDERGDHAREHVGGGRHALDAEREVAGAADYSLVKVNCQSICGSIAILFLI